MVTFPTDYWAPALDVNVRRREQPPARERVTKSSVSRNIKEATPNIDTSANKGPLTSSSERTLAENGSRLSLKASSSSSNSISSNSSTEKTPITPSEKKLNLVQSMHRLFVHDRKSPDNSPLNPPEDAEELFGATPDNKSILKGILSPRLDVDHKSLNRVDSATDISKLIEPDCLLFKKYGIYEKGCIGRGATAVVRLAHKLDDPSPEKSYAVKEFRKRKKNETEKAYIKKLHSEFCISSSLEHVNVVKTVDLMRDENQNWCEVMEYCSGGDLYTAIKAGHMTSVEINCCFKQLIRGVAYLHSMGVAHRDIKPENLLLDNKGHLKITDFGVSEVFRTCWEEDAHMSRGVCGSEPYIAPEQFETKEYDPRLVDVWACGIVYYCMIYRGIPFRMAITSDINFTNYLDARSAGQYEQFEKLPRGCRNLMYRILEPDARKRITIAAIKDDLWFKGIECCTDDSGPLFQEHHHIPPENLKVIQFEEGIDIMHSKK